MLIEFLIVGCVLRLRRNTYTGYKLPVLAAYFPCLLGILGKEIRPYWANGLFYPTPNKPIKFMPNELHCVLAGEAS